MDGFTVGYSTESTSWVSNGDSGDVAKGKLVDVSAWGAGESGNV